MQKRKLYVALTREPEAFGISYKMFIVVGFTTLILFLGSGSFWAFIVGIPVYFIFRNINKTDPGLTAVVITKYKQCPKVTNNQYWGGANSYDTRLDI